jgi:hypothetical protein
MSFFGRLFEFLTSTEVLVGLFWAGLAALTVTLFVLMRTRWGQYKPLRKCMLLSLFAHVLLASYASTVSFIAKAPPHTEAEVVHVRIGESLDEDEAEFSQDGTIREEAPWDTFKHNVVAELQPQELTRAESAEMADPLRQNDTKESGLPGQASLDHVRTPDTSPADIAQLPADAVSRSPAAPQQAAPIDAPAPQAQVAAPVNVPDQTDLARQAGDAPSEFEPVRQSASGVPSALLERSVTVPRMQDAPNSLETADTLHGLTESFASPAYGSPAPWFSNSSQSASGAPGGGSQQPGGQDLEPVGTLAGGAAGSGIAVASRPLPEDYKQRMAPNRAEIGRSRGGTAETEQAVQAALKWLADNQSSDGRWSARQFGAGRELRVLGQDRQNAGIRADTAMTGLALLAFLAAGNTHQDGPYRENVRRGLQMLLNAQTSDGSLGGDADWYAYMYSHGMAAIALSEAYGMSRDARLRRPVERAVGFTLACQNRTTGGWRYARNDDGDTSQLGWQLMVLKSAELAGIPMPQESRAGAIRFLNSVASGEHRGLASYRPGERATRAMTAEALACRQFVGIAQNAAANREAGDHLLGELPGEGVENLYYWYYGTMAMYHLQGTHWERWNEALQRTLLASQVKTGPQTGSWHPTCLWGGYGGRVYSTALAALSLEVYYRYLPLYGSE